jgi:hypothetical protein
MVATIRIQNRYDHRLRELVHKAQDVSCALQYGVPRSTARSWLTAPSVEVVTADPLNMDALELQQEVLRLWTRIQKLIALLRVLLVVLKISRFSLDQTRLPDGRSIPAGDRPGAGGPSAATVSASSARRRVITTGTAQLAFDDRFPVQDFHPSNGTLAEVRAIQDRQPRSTGTPHRTKDSRSTPRQVLPASTCTG